MFCKKLPFTLSMIIPYDEKNKKTKKQKNKKTKKQKNKKTKKQKNKIILTGNNEDMTTISCGITFRDCYS